MFFKRRSRNEISDPWFHRRSHHHDSGFCSEKATTFSSAESQERYVSGVWIGPQKAPCVQAQGAIKGLSLESVYSKTGAFGLMCRKLSRPFSIFSPPLWGTCPWICTFKRRSPGFPGLLRSYRYLAVNQFTPKTTMQQRTVWLMDNHPLSWPIRALPVLVAQILHRRQKGNGE